MTGGIIAASAVVVVIIIVVVSLRVRARARWREQMDALLRGLGLEVHALEPTIRASGSYRGLELAIEGAHTFAGGAAVFATKITVTGGNPPAFAVQRVGVGTAPAGQSAVLTGDPGFDARYRVYASSAAQALWRDEERRADVLALGEKVGELIELRVEEGVVIATLTGTRLAPEVLRAGINLAYGAVAG